MRLTQLSSKISALFTGSGTAVSKRTKFTLPDLPYDYNALEPVISEEIMRLHHLKHHQTYVNTLNDSVAKLKDAIDKQDASQQVALGQTIKFNAGGHINHSIFWQNLCPPGKCPSEPTDKLREAIEESFGSFEKFQDLFSRNTAAVQGSGWGWLGYNPISRKVEFATTANQDPLIATRGLIPLLGVDVWEHAYYLQYKNVRPDYLKAIWQIINWEDVATRYYNCASIKKVKIQYNSPYSGGLVMEAIELICQLTSVACPQLSENIENDSQLISFFQKLAESLSTHFFNYESMEKTVSESRLRQVNLEQSLKNLQNKTIKEREEIIQLKESLEIANNQIAELNAKINNESADASKESYIEQVEFLKVRCGKLEVEKNDLVRLDDRRQIEIDSLTKQLDVTSTKIRELRELLLSKETELSDSRSKSINLQSQLENAQEEIEKCRKQEDWNKQELEKISTDFSAYRRQKGAENSTLNGKIAFIEAENDSITQQITTLRSSLEEKDRKINELLKRLNEAEMKMANSESQFVIEMESKVKLADLYKETLEDANIRIEEMENMLKASQQINLQVDEQINRVKSEFDVEINELKDQLHQKEKEIQMMRVHMDERGGRGPNGKSLSEVYSEYAQAKSELVQSKSEVTRLKTCIEDICQDLEKRVPILQAEREENERLKKDIEAMANQLLQESSAKDKGSVVIRKLEAELAECKDTKILLQKQVSDLSYQVQTLLAEMEGIPVPERDSSPVSRDQEVVDADKIIGERLLAFRNIQELQIRNQELVTAIRSLSQQQESSELSRLQKSEAELRNLLEVNTKELSELREQRHKQTILVESLIRQRDMLRTMGSLASNQELLTSTLSTHPSEPTLVELQTEYEVFRREKKESESYLEGQLNNAQRELSETKGKLNQISAQLEFSQERYSLLKDNYELERKELYSLRQSNSAALASISQHQVQVQNLMNEVVTGKERQEQLSSQISSLRVELELTRNSEKRLLEQISSLTAEKERLNNLLLRLEAIKEENEGEESSFKRHLADQVEFLEKELSFTRQKLSDEMESHKLALSISDRDYRDLVRRHEQMMESYGNVKEDYAKIKAELSESSRKVQDLELLYRRSEERMEELLKPNFGTAGNDLPRELAAAKARISLLEDELRLSKEHSTTFQEMAKCAEDSLLELTRTYDEYQITVEKQTAEFAATNEDLLAQINMLESKLQELEQSSSLSEQNSRKRIAELEASLSELKEYADMASSHSILRKEDVDRLQQLVHDSRESYEQEVVAHGKDLEALTALRQELSDHSKKMNLLNDDYVSTKDKLKETEMKLAESQSLVDRATFDLKERLSELEQQNTLLLSQLEKRTELPLSTGNEEEVKDSSRQQQLLEVVKYLRRQKEILQIEHDNLQNEHRRSKQQSEHLQRSLDETRALLAEEKSSSSWQSQMATEYKILLEKVEQLNILRESNTTLRSESESLSRKVNELEAQLRSAQEKLTPREEEVRVLTAQVHTLKEEVSMIRRDRDNWKMRFDQAIERYRIDPGESEELKKQIENLQGQVSQLSTRLEESENNHKEELNAQIAEYDKQAERLKGLEGKHKDLITKARQVLAEKNELAKSVKELEAKFSTASVEPQAVPVDSAELETLKQQRTSLEEEKNQLSQMLNTSQTELEEVKKQLNETNQKLDKYREAIKKLNNLREMHIGAKAEIETLKAELQKAEQKAVEIRNESEIRSSLLVSTWQGKVHKLEAEVGRLKNDKQTGISDLASPIIEVAEPLAKRQKASDQGDVNEEEVLEAEGDGDEDEEGAVETEAAEPNVPSDHEDILELSEFEELAEEGENTEGDLQGEELTNEGEVEEEHDMASTNTSSLPSTSRVIDLSNISKRRVPLPTAPSVAGGAQRVEKRQGVVRGKSSIQGGARRSRRGA